MVWSPLDMLAARVQQQQGAPVAPAPTAAPAAPPPAPTASDPTPQGSGGIGGNLQRAFSGEGIFGTPDMSTDPLTGMPRELGRRANNQSIMKMGMMLMVAGMRNTDQGRAAILSQIPAMADTSDQVNNFARTRLELAKVKLAEKEMLAHQASSAAINAAIVGGDPAAAGATRNPTGAGAALDPSLPGQVPAVPVGPVSPVAGPTAVPAAPGGPPAPATAPEASAAAPPAALPLDKAPPAPPMPAFQVPTAIALMAPGQVKTQAYIAAQREAQKAEYSSEPYIDSKMGKVVADVYVAGRKVRRQVMGDIPTEIVDKEIDDQGTVERQTVQVGTGKVVKKETIHDPEYTEARAATNKVITSDREKYTKQYEESAAPSVSGYERLGALAADVRAGKAITGTLAGARTWVANTLASLGLADKDTIEQLKTGMLTQQQLRRAAGEFAKTYYGPQVSNVDVQNAEKVLGAAMSNNKELIGQALEEMQREARKKIETYNAAADKHNARVQRSPNLDKEIFTLPKVDYDFRPKDQPLTPGGGQPQPAGSGKPAQIIPPGITPEMAKQELERRRRAAQGK